jgi:hypothetical protein
MCATRRGIKRAACEEAEDEIAMRCLVLMGKAIGVPIEFPSGMPNY